MTNIEVLRLRDLIGREITNLQEMIEDYLDMKMPNIAQIKKLETEVKQWTVVEDKLRRRC